MTEKRLVDLELRYMTLHRTVEELSHVMASQQKTLDQAMAEIKRLRERLLELGDSPSNEPPPHY
jgi:uncharacterized coiled-coil protein SlyX